MRYYYLLKNPDLIQWFAFDILYRPISKKLIAIIVYLTGVVLLICMQKRRALQHFMSAQRYHPTGLYARSVVMFLEDLPALYPSRMQNDITVENAVSRSIIKLGLPIRYDTSSKLRIVGVILSEIY